MSKLLKSTGKKENDSISEDGEARGRKNPEETEK